MYLRSEGRCGICHSPVTPLDVVIDHIIPYARGGTDSPVNMQIAHRECNANKAARMPGETKRGTAIPPPPSDRDKERWTVTIQQAAEQLGTSPPEVRQAIDSGALPAVQLPGRQWRIVEADLERFIAEHQEALDAFLRGEQSE